MGWSLTGKEMNPPTSVGQLFLDRASQQESDLRRQEEKLAFKRCLSAQKREGAQGKTSKGTLPSFPERKRKGGRNTLVLQGSVNNKENTSTPVCVPFLDCLAGITPILQG